MTDEGTGHGGRDRGARATVVEGRGLSADADGASTEPGRSEGRVATTGQLIGDHLVSTRAARAGPGRSGGCRRWDDVAPNGSVTTGAADV